MRSDIGNVPGFYVRQVPGKLVSIELNLDVVDRLQQEVMRGFGAVPRRGVEIGGILLGTVANDGSTVLIEDYAAVPIQYKLGPSYRLCEEDVRAFENTLGKPQPLRAIGYFRSHTREGSELSEEDLALLEKYFPDAESVALIIRPFATKPCLASFYFKESGVFQNGAAALEIPFRRKDLAPEPGSHSTPLRKPEAPAAEPHVAKRRFVIPLSTILLIAGILLGYQAALTIRPPSDAYSLALAVTQSGSDLKINWDRRSPAIQTAQSGTLNIEDGSYNKSTSLTAAQLRIGSAGPYQPLTKHVRFRLDVSPTPRNTISETIDWTANQRTKEPSN